MNDINNAPELIDTAPLERVVLIGAAVVIVVSGAGVTFAVVVAAVLIVASGAGVTFAVVGAAVLLAVGSVASVIVKISESITKHDNIFIDIFKGDLLALSFKF